MSNRLDQEREKRLQPERMKFAKDFLTHLGFEITKETEAELNFIFKGETIKLFPYSGWHQGKGIKAGRGIKKLLEQIAPK